MCANELIGLASTVDKHPSGLEGEGKLCCPAFHSVVNALEYRLKAWHPVSHRWNKN